MLTGNRGGDGLRWPRTLLASLLCTILVLPAHAEPADRKYEGVWYISDSTDNNTGEREVYAFQTYIKADDFVGLKMRCSAGKPTFFVEWEDRDFPDQTVLTIASTDIGAAEQQYVFEKSTDTIERGLRASTETSAKIVTALAQAKYASFTAHLATGSRLVVIEVDGTQRAWARVSRHCPIRKQPLPAL